MRRSGKLLVILLSVAALVGCAAVPEPVATEEPPPAASCPEGLAGALEAHMLEQPLGDRMPTRADVRVFTSDAPFLSPLVASLVGCAMTLVTTFENGDRAGQMFGIADGYDEAGVIAEFEAAGWEQLFPETDPGVWAAADPSEGARIFTSGGANPPLGFESWADYLAPGDVVLESGMAF